MKKEHFLHERKKKHFLMCDAEWCFFLLPKTLFRGNISSVLHEKVILFSQFHTRKTFLSDLNNQTLVWCFWFSPIKKNKLYFFVFCETKLYFIPDFFFSLCTHFKERFFFFYQEKRFFWWFKIMTFSRRFFLYVFLSPLSFSFFLHKKPFDQT